MLLLVFWVAAQEPGRYDVVIHEIFADPTPSRGMPASEFVEIRNISKNEWNLRNWTFSTGGTAGRINSSYVLKPDSIVILCGTSLVNTYAAYGNVLAVTSFPSLNNDGDTLNLMSPAGTVIHALAWDKRWYRNDLKQEGGWSLEMIDIKKPCMGNQNWDASKDPKGGTPGKKNSIQGVTADSVKPAILFSYMPDSLTVEILFTEPLDKIPAVSSIQLEPARTISGLKLKPPLYNGLQFTIAGPVNKEELFRITMNGTTDCSGNIAPSLTSRTGIFSEPLAGDLVINEILFNPPVGGSDYIELYNISRKNLDAGAIKLANRNGNNQISSLTSLSSFPYPVFPGEYLLLTTNPSWISNKYRPPDSIKILELPAMPSYPDDEGEVVLLNNTGLILDELNYDEKWHFELLSEREGVSLERIKARAITQDPGNWHSASTSSGYGTPGYRNSQTASAQTDQGLITLSSKIISPDMDGRDDFLLIRYAFPKPGNVASVVVYDANGRAVRDIARSSLCGSSGFFRWDGLNDSGGKLSSAVYIIIVEIFDIQGKTKRYKNTVGVYH